MLHECIFDFRLSSVQQFFLPGDFMTLRSTSCFCIDVWLFLLKTVSCFQFYIQGRIQGDNRGVVTPSLRKKNILQKISHLRLHCKPMRGFDHGLTLATNRHCKPSQKSHSFTG